MIKIAKGTAAAIAYAAAAFAVAFFVPVQSASGYGKEVRRLAARLQGTRPADRAPDQTMAQPAEPQYGKPFALTAARPI